MTPHDTVPPEDTVLPSRPGTDEPARASPAGPTDRDVDVLVVGAAQAGLGAAQHLTRDPGLRVLVLDAAPAARRAPEPGRGHPLPARSAPRP